MEVRFWAPAMACSFFEAENLDYHFPRLYHLHSSVPSGMVPKERILWVLLLLYEIYDEERGSILLGGLFFYSVTLHSTLTTVVHRIGACVSPPQNHTASFSPLFPKGTGALG